MGVYTYFFLNADGFVPVFEFEQCSREEEASERALELLSRRPERHAVEVWNEDRLICRRRPPAPAAPEQSCWTVSDEGAAAPSEPSIERQPR